MKTNQIVLGILCVLFAVIEQYCHSEYHKKHPDYDKSYSGVIGFIILAIAIFAWRM